MMKQILALGMLAALVSWPTLGEAANKKKTVRSKPAPVAQHRHAPNGYAYPPNNRRAHSPNPAWDVYFTDGAYAGSDPDPFIRQMLERDDPRSKGSN